MVQRGRVAEKFEKNRRKQTKEKHWKMKRKKREESRESQIKTTTIFGFTFCVSNHILLQSIVWKTAVYTITFCLQLLGIAWYLKHKKDAPKLNIHKYAKYNLIEIYVNRLSTTRLLRSELETTEGTLSARAQSFNSWLISQFYCSFCKY